MIEYFFVMTAASRFLTFSWLRYHMIAFLGRPQITLRRRIMDYFLVIFSMMIYHDIDYIDAWESSFKSPQRATAASATNWWLWH